MKLRNPFPLEVRLLYDGVWKCWTCGQNGTQRGGLEINHILGRGSDCAFNSSLLCHMCHSHIGHSVEEQAELFKKTFLFLHSIHYKPTEEDYQFLKDHWLELGRPAITEWI